jgi:hypothetical protein
MGFFLVAGARLGLVLQYLAVDAWGANRPFGDMAPRSRGHCRIRVRMAGGAARLISLVYGS